MINFSSSAVFYIHKEPINMLNGFEGLSTAIKAKFNNEIKKDSFYLFLNKKKDRIKIIYWDIDGLAIWYKRLEKGKFLLKTIDKKVLNRKEFILLLEGIVPKHIQKRFSL